MPRYHFSATDADGVSRQGEIEAIGPAEAAAELELVGWTVLNVGPAAGESSAGAISTGEARLLVDQLATLTASELPLGPGLRALAEEVGRGRTRSLVRDLADRVDRGESLPAALEAEGHRLPGHLRGLLLAGTRSGRPGVLLGEFVGYAQLGASLRRGLWVRLAYPLLLLFLFVAVVVLLCIYVVSGFKTIFADFGVDVPMITRVVFDASDAVTATGLRVLVLPWMLGLVAWIAGRLLLDRVSRRRLLNALPLFGPLWRLTSMAEFSHFLAVLSRAELPLATAIPLAVEGTGDAALEASCGAMVDELNQGATLAEAAARSPEMPPGFASILGWAEGHQSLPETLHMTGEIFEAHARTRAAFVAAVVTVLTVILVLWGCMVMVVALFLPLLQLISRLSG